MMQKPAPATCSRPAKCDIHGDHDERGFTLMGRTVWTGCMQCNQIAADAHRAETQRNEAQAAQRRLETRMQAAGIPERFKSRSFDNYRVDHEKQQRALSAVRDMVDNFGAHQKRGTFLFLSGIPGTGKTHLALSAAQSVMDRTTVAYLSVADLVNAVRATWSKGADLSTDGTIRMYADIGLLVLDEVGVQSGTDNELNILFSVLDKRYANCKPTILLTNLSHKALEELVGDRLWRRFMEVGKWVPFAWDPAGQKPAGGDIAGNPTPA